MARQRRAVVNVACGSWYPHGQKRLRQSLNDIGEDSERIFLTRFPGKTHRAVPYGFKLDALREAESRGYDRLIWMDASLWVKRPLDEAWEQLERDGYLIGREGWTVGYWCSPEVQAKTGYTREQLDRMTLILGGFLGLNLSHPTGREFLARWEQARDDGWFNGPWTSHRHDMTAGGIVAHEMGLKLTDHLIAFPTRRDPGPPEAYCYARGM